MSDMNSKIIETINDLSNKIAEIYFDNKEICDVINKALKLDDNEKLALAKNMLSKFLLVPNGTELLNNKKVKLFSSKEEETYQLSISLFGEDLPLKKIFNNIDGKNKDYLWVSLKLLINYHLPKKTKNPILNVEVDDGVNTMINDIVAEFKNSMAGKENENPMNAILDITSKITSKYQSKLETGEIKLNNLIEDLTKNMPGVKDMMEKLIPKEKPKEKKPKVIIDDNFSTSNVVVGEDKPEESNYNIKDLLPLLKNMGSASKFAENLLGKDFEEMTKTLGDANSKDPVKLQEMKNTIDKMMKDKFNIDSDKLKKDLNI